MSPRILPLALAAVAACGGDPAGPVDAPSTACAEDAPPTRTASCVDAFSPGPDAGFGQDAFPEIVYGPPHGGGSAGGGVDVLSLGRGGEIILGFGGNAIVDGPGADFIVFENPFLVNGDPEKVFKELGEVSASADGETWSTFPCREDAYPHDGCAGWRPVIATPDSGDAMFDPALAGGDSFDLADLALPEARLIRIRDLSELGGADTAGFDLDAVSIVHSAR